MKKLIRIIAATVLLTVTVAACSHKTATQKEQGAANTQLTNFLLGQPIPQFNYSQLRQNLIELETAQAGTTATTSFFFNQGVADPAETCPSIGFPIPSTYQLTNPLKAVNGGIVAQIEATGVYTANTSGTYVICVGSNGKGEAIYHEGFVSAVSGPAHWDLSKHMIVLDGPSSAEFTATKKP